MGVDNVGLNMNAMSNLENTLMQQVDSAVEQGRGGQGGVEREMNLLSSIMNQYNGGGGDGETAGRGSSRTNLENALARNINSRLQEGYTGRGTQREMKLLNDLLRPQNSSQRQGTQQWSATNNGNGTASINLGNYTLNLNKASAGITLTDNATGAVTNISGDPHVTENGQTWTFKNNTTFQLADGTDITIKTTPAGNGQTLSSEVDISKGSQSITVTGLSPTDSNSLQISEGFGGKQMRASNSGDPVVYEAGDQWMSRSGQVVNAQYVTGHEDI